MAGVFPFPEAGTSRRAAGTGPRGRARPPREVRRRGGCGGCGDHGGAARRACGRDRVRRRARPPTRDRCAAGRPPRRGPRVPHGRGLPRPASAARPRRHQG
ncbi:MAG: hypothetical protein ACK55I_25990, partial [bacterium]